MDDGGPKDLVPIDIMLLAGRLLSEYGDTRFSDGKLSHA